MNLYIADTHFGHNNVIRFDHRPFSDIDEMDNVMIHLWNDRVRNDDHVYIIGDFSYRGTKSASWYLKRLKGIKHLVTGNHDFTLMKDERAKSYFESIRQIEYVEDTYNGENISVVLCHYPILEWQNMRRGAYHIYGHIHNNTDNTYQIISQFDHALNAGAAINNYTPVSFRELVENNRQFQEKVRNGFSKSKETTGNGNNK